MLARLLRPRVGFPFQKRAAVIRRCNSTPTWEEKRLRFKMWNDIWGHYKRVHIAVKVASGVVLGGFSLYLWKFAGKKEAILPSFGSVDDSIMRAFEDGKGVKLYEKRDRTASVSRSDLHNRLAPILHPESITEYAVIVGENGTGKSTAVRQVLARLKHPKGVVYFNSPVDPRQFSLELANLIECEAEVDIKGGIERYFERSTKEVKQTDLPREPMFTFTEIMRPLLAAAEKFEQKHGRPMVLVIDSADRLAKKDPDFLAVLQDFAKDCADFGTLRIVFISSDGSALPLLMSRSAWSRAKQPAFEVGEITDEAAVQYLKDCGVSSAVAERAVRELTGGLFASLNHFVSNNSEGRKLEEIVEEMDNRTETTLLYLGMPPEHAVFQHLVANKRIRSKNAHKLKMSEKLTEDLVKRNILATHPNGTLTFHDRHVQVWFHRTVSTTAPASTTEIASASKVE